MYMSLQYTDKYLYQHGRHTNPDLWQTEGPALVCTPTPCNQSVTPTCSSVGCLAGPATSTAPPPQGYPVNNTAKHIGIINNYTYNMLHIKHIHTFCTNKAIILEVYL